MSLSTNIKTLKLLADETRLKILRIAREAEFTVNEFVQILNLHQSNISRHLNQLKEAKMLSDRKEGTLNYYRWSENLRADDTLGEVIETVFDDLADKTSILQMTREILQQRRQKTKNFFDEIAGRYHRIAEPGGGWQAVAEAFNWSKNRGVGLDIGCGEGDLSLILAKRCEKVYSVDLSEEMLKILDQESTRLKLSHLKTLPGDVENLPLNANSVDIALMSQVLHHATSPQLAIAELKRVLKSNAEFIILDLLSHNQEWMREQMGDHWLGFEIDTLVEWLKEADLKVEIKQVVEVKDGLPVLLICGYKK